MNESANLAPPPPPSASISSPGDHQTFNLNQSVQTTFSCTEGSNGPGLQSCADSHGISGTTGTLQGSLDTSTAGAHTYTVTATSKDSETGTATIHYTVIAPPSVSISAPADGATYAQGQVVDSSFRCSDGAGGPGITSCLDQNGHPLGTAIDTSTTGSHTFIVTATSGDGQSRSATVSYTVAPLTISAISLHPRSFKANKGTTLKLTLSAAATVKAAIYRSGLQRRGKCMATVMIAKTCAVKLETLTFTGVASRNHFRIKTNRLKPGSYTLVLTASSSTGTTREHRLTFTIKP
jgi:hypothetical protein